NPSRYFWTRRPPRGRDRPETQRPVHSGVFAFARQAARRPRSPRREDTSRGSYMTRNCMIASAAVVTALCAAATAADPRVNTLREEIKVLRAQEPAILKAVRERYDLLVKRERLSESALRQQRHVLGQEEEQLLAVAANPEAKAEIRTRYDRLRKYVGGEIKL